MRNKHAQQHRYYSSKPRSWKGSHLVTSRRPGEWYGHGQAHHAGLRDKKSNLDGLSWPRTSKIGIRNGTQRAKSEKKQSRRQRRRKVATGGEAPTQWLERSSVSAGAREPITGDWGRLPQSRGNAPGRRGWVRAKHSEAESFGGPLADIVRFTNLLYLAFYGHQKEMANLSTLLFQFKAGQRTDSSF